MKPESGALLRRLLCGLCKTNAYGADLWNIKIAKAKRGLRVAFTIGDGALAKIVGDGVPLAANSPIGEERDKMALHIQTMKLNNSKDWKKLSSGRPWKTVASFSDKVDALECYQHVYRDYNDALGRAKITPQEDVRLVAESADGLKVLQGKGGDLERHAA